MPKLPEKQFFSIKRIGISREYRLDCAYGAAINALEDVSEQFLSFGTGSRSPSDSSWVYIEVEPLYSLNQVRDFIIDFLNEWKKEHGK